MASLESGGEPKSSDGSPETDRIHFRSAISAAIVPPRTKISPIAART
jgi:hypothetical protein